MTNEETEKIIEEIAIFIFQSLNYEDELKLRDMESYSGGSMRERIKELIEESIKEYEKRVVSQLRTALKCMQDQLLTPDKFLRGDLKENDKI